RVNFLPSFEMREVWGRCSLLFLFIWAFRPRSATMRKAVWISVGFLVSAALTSVAAAQTYQWKVKSSVTDVYVRSNPGGFMIGTLFSDDSFRWKQTNGSDFWGRCGGTAQMCGWVPSTY